MDVQPPLARILVAFCYGRNELQIAYHEDLSLFNVVERLRKSVHAGQKFLRL